MENERIYFQEKIKNEYRVNQYSIPSEKHLDRNEDKIYINQEKDVFALFDGVGGIKNGDVASLNCVNKLNEECLNIEKSNSEDKIELFLKEVIAKINQKNFEEGVCSTGLIGVVYGEEKNKKMMLVNVGDSRCYLMRKGNLYQISIDDNSVSEMYGYNSKSIELQNKLNNIENPESELSGAEQVFFASRNRITAALGKKENATGRIYRFNINNGDKVLFCSDGISDNLTDKEIKNILINTNKEAEALILKAKEVSRSNSARSKKDDMSAIVVNF